MNLMFQPQFEPLILSGRKPHTIRPKRKIPLKVGQSLSLRVWTGKPYRSPQREFMAAVVEDVRPIVIGRERIIVNGVQLTRTQSDALAHHDGFATFKDLRLWFDHNHGEAPFVGEIISWGKPSLRYSRKRPTVPGWYWCQNAGDKPGEIWEAVVRLEQPAFGGELLCSWMTAPGAAAVMLAANWSDKCLWAGPIHPPKS